jgi:hypothetical protein
MSSEVSRDVTFKYIAPPKSVITLIFLMAFEEGSPPSKNFFHFSAWLCDFIDSFILLGYNLIVMR